jgi:hypothetical protein
MEKEKDKGQTIDRMAGICEEGLEDWENSILFQGMPCKPMNSLDMFFNPANIPV